MEPKNIAIVCMFVAVALGLLATAFAFPSDTVERFEEKERETETEPGIKLHVIEMFNLLLDRNPSPDEITKYGAMKDKDAVSRHIIEDYSNTSEDTASDRRAPAAAAPLTVDVKSIGRRLRALADEIDPPKGL